MRGVGKLVGAVIAFGLAAQVWGPELMKRAGARAVVDVPLPRPRPHIAAAPLVPPEVRHVPLGTYKIMGIQKVGGVWLALYHIDSDGVEHYARLVCPTIMPVVKWPIEVEAVYYGAHRSEFGEARCSLAH